VTTVVRGRVFVDLYENDVLIACVLGDPVGIDEYFLACLALCLSPELVCGSTAEVRGTDDRTRGYEGSGADKSPERSGSRRRERASTFAEADTTTSASGRGQQRAGG
jgi:hypothetical protein